MDTVARETLNFVLIGGKHTGKTVYLSTLFGAEKSIVSANTTTKEYLQSNWKYIKNGETPAATSGRLIYLNLLYKTNKYNLTFRIDDYDGYLAETLSVDDEHTQKDREELKENIENAEGLLFFFPYGKDFDQESLENFSHEINTFILLLKEVWEDKPDIPIPVAIAVTKWDNSPHYKKPDEKQKITEYIESIEPYKVAKDQINAYFSSVKEFPLSSFGFSNDGVNPVKGNIHPYNLIAPIDYFLENFFITTARCFTKLKTENNYPELFRTLFMWYNHIKFYDNEKYKKLFNEVQQSYSDEILLKLDSVQTISERKKIIDDNAFFINNMDDEKAQKMIYNKLSEVKGERTKKQFKISLTIVLFILIVGYLGGMYQSYNNEKNLLTKIKVTDKSSYGELLNLCEQYLKEFRSSTLFIPYTIDEHRISVEKILAVTKSSLRDTLQTRFNSLNDVDLTEKNLRLIKRLRDEANHFPDLNITKSINSFANNFEDKFNAIKDQKQIKLETFATAKRLIADPDADVNELTDTLEAVNLLSDQKDTQEILPQLLIKLKTMKIQDSFNRIMDDLNDGNKSFADTKKIITENWTDGFSKAEKQTMIDMIDREIRSVDEAEIKNLYDKFESSAEIERAEQLMEKIKNNKLKIDPLEYRYVRSKTFTNKIEGINDSIIEHKDALNGIYVSIEFRAQKNNEPLGLDCEGYMQEKDIILYIGSKKFHYKEDNGSCSPEGITQVMQWEKVMFITKMRYHVKAIEWDPTPYMNDECEGSITITEEDLLFIFNHGVKDIQISGTDYTLRLKN